MIHHPLSVPADACPPDADRAGPVVPENIARLLYVLRILLELGRHLAATMERRAAAPGFWLFRAIFGTADLSVIVAHLRRGILRAAALESLLLARAAAGRDVAQSPPHTPGAHPGTDPHTESLQVQIARLAAERARHDATIDPNNPSTAEDIEAEVRTRAVGRTIGDIGRDLGVVAFLCTREFWDTLEDVITRHEASAAICPEDTQPVPESLPRQPEQDPLAQQMQPGTTLPPHRASRFAPGQLVAAPFRFKPAPPRLRPRVRHTIPVSNKSPAAAVKATGPPRPPRAAMKRAA